MIDVNTIFPCESSEEERERRNRRPLSFLRMDSLLRRICFLKGCFLLYTYERNRSILSTHLSVQNALLVRLATEVKVCTLDAVEGPLDSKPFKLEKSREEWGVGEKRFLFSRRARARCYDSMHIHALVFSTALRGFSIALFSYPSFSFIISQLSTHLSFRARRKPWCPNPSRLFSIFSPLRKKRVLLRVVVERGVHFVFSFSSSSFVSSLLVSKRRRFIRFARSIGGKKTHSPTTGTRSSHGHVSHAQCANRFPHLHRERKRNGTTLSRGTQQPPRHTTVILLFGRRRRPPSSLSSSLSSSSSSKSSQSFF